MNAVETMKWTRASGLADDVYQSLTTAQVALHDIEKRLKVLKHCPAEITIQVGRSTQSAPSRVVLGSVVLCSAAVTLR